jgi:ribosomal protein S18 acetylase RimI-like enzyme
MRGKSKSQLPPDHSIQTRIGDIVVRQLTPEELSRASEIDVSETGEVVYKSTDTGIHPERESWTRPSWDARQWKDNIDRWATRMHWNVMLGAFCRERLVGLASLRYTLSEQTAQIVSLHVSRDYRRQGIATRLAQELVWLAHESGARRMYVSATPSESAVGFYMSQGFAPTKYVNKELFDLEPEDIHMMRTI